MNDGRRRSRILPGALVGAALAVLTLLAGCGVPSTGPPVVVSRAPVNGSSDDLGPRFSVVPHPSAATSPRDLINLFLTAAGADPRPEQVRENVQQFFTADVRNSWEPDPEGMTVVRITESRASEQSATPTATPSASASASAKAGSGTTATATVTVTGQIVGLLTAQGAIQPLPGDRDSTFHKVFQLTRNNRVWRIANPPERTLLSTDAIGTEYDAVTVYFVTPNHKALVPDLRYLPNTMRAEKRRTVLVDSLLAGPSRWLEHAVDTAIPEGTKRRGNVVISGKKLIVNLTSEASNASDPTLMSAQLAWTLRTVRAQGMQIRIEGRPLKVPGISGRNDDDWEVWRSYNPATSNADSNGYYISDGHVVPVDPSDPLPLPLTGSNASRIDSHLLRAGLSVDGRHVALVHQGARRQQLWLGQMAGPDGNATTFTQVTGLPAGVSIGRPSFVGDTGGVLVPVGGALRSVTSGGASQAVAFSGHAPADVTAVAVAPEGCRVALVAAGHLYVAPLTTIGDGDRVTVGRMHQLAESFTELSRVAWTEDTKVVFGGRGTTGAPGLLARGPQGGAWSFSVDDVYSDLLTGSDDNLVPRQIASSTNDSFKGAPHGKVLLAAHGQILAVTGNLVGPPNGAATPPSGVEPFFPG